MTTATSSVLSPALTYLFFLPQNNIAEATHSPNNPYSSLTAFSSHSMTGIISSMILDIAPFNIPFLENKSNDLDAINMTTVGKIILVGQWNLTFNNVSSIESKNRSVKGTELQIEDFEANFIAVSKDGTGAHTHQISNFKPIVVDSSKDSQNETQSGIIRSTSTTQDADLHAFGVVDVGMNGLKMWDSVHASITISKGRTIEIMLDERDVDYHFGKGQPIYGLVSGVTLD